MAEKLIFLDFDGVLNTGYYHAQCLQERRATRDQYGPLFDPRAVENLAEVIYATGAKIVITSSWRFLGLEMMQQMWQSRQLPGEIQDIAPLNLYENVSRANEIRQYLLGRDAQFVIFDDIDDSFHGELRDHLILCNPQRGISRPEALQAILLLS